jgi:hypothetical protein
MTLKQRLLKCDAFMYELRYLVWKYAGSDYEKADKELLFLMQANIGLFNKSMWPVPLTTKKRKSTSAKKGKK